MDIRWTNKSTGKINWLFVSLCGWIENVCGGRVSHKNCTTCLLVCICENGCYIVMRCGFYCMRACVAWVCLLERSHRRKNFHCRAAPSAFDLNRSCRYDCSFDNVLEGNFLQIFTDSIDCQYLQCVFEITVSVMLLFLIALDEMSSTFGLEPSKWPWTQSKFDSCHLNSMQNVCVFPYSSSYFIAQDYMLITIVHNNTAHLINRREFSNVVQQIA